MNLEQAQITDEAEKKVFAALSGVQQTWRTVRAIARETGLDEKRVEEIVRKYNLQLTRFAESRSISGSALVGLIEKVGA
ncbi:MAG TPA: hypothetical protein VFA77_18040 [Candidatus Eisenbacteria bacterium]|jgi:hypothetical protein|nr:hypothetical protein [Candidatus Eisenbacteria bacterium]